MTTANETDLAAATRLLQETFVIEGHRDCYEQIYWQNMGEQNPVADRLVPRLRTGGVDVVVYSVGGDSIAHCNSREKRFLATVENIVSLRLAREAMRPSPGLVRTSADLPPVGDGTADGNVQFLMHLEGASPLEGSMAALEALFQLGVRSIQPTWNLRNELGDGVRERATKSGLTTFGVAAVQRMQELGIVVDLAHISETGFWHALEVTEGPVTVSHANSRAIYDHPRNLTDDQVRAIAERDGVVGLHTLPTFTGPGNPTIDDLLRHLDHLVDVAGVEHVSFGGDFVASDGPRPAREAIFHDPREAPPTIPRLAEVDELPNLAAAMLAHGFSTDDVTAVLGGNLRRMLSQVLPTE